MLDKERSYTRCRYIATSPCADLHPHPELLCASDQPICGVRCFESLVVRIPTVLHQPGLFVSPPPFSAVMIDEGWSSSLALIALPSNVTVVLLRTDYPLRFAITHTPDPRTRYNACSIHRCANDSPTSSTTALVLENASGDNNGATASRYFASVSSSNGTSSFGRLDWYLNVPLVSATALTVVSFTALSDTAAVAGAAVSASGAAPRQRCEVVSPVVDCGALEVAFSAISSVASELFFLLRSWWRRRQRRRQTWRELRLSRCPKGNWPDFKTSALGGYTAFSSWHPGRCARHIWGLGVWP